MKTRSSAAKRVAGAYLHGKVFWCRYSLGGRQHRISLGSEDEATAIARAIEIRANPELADINHLKLEIKNYVQHQLENHKITRNSGPTGRWFSTVGLIIWARTGIMSLTDATAN